MGALIGMLGVLGFLGCIVWLIVLAVKKRPKKICLISLAASIILFNIGIAITPESKSAPTQAEPPASSNTGSIVSSMGAISSRPQSDTTSSENIEIPESSSEYNEDSQVDSNTENVTITKEKYDKIRSGMTYEEVKKIVGGDGEAYYEYGDKGTDEYTVNYKWYGDALFSMASITCTGKNEKVIAKSQGGLK